MYVPSVDWSRVSIALAKVRPAFDLHKRVCGTIGTTAHRLPTFVLTYQHATIILAMWTARTSNHHNDGSRRVTPNKFPSSSRLLPDTVSFPSTYRQPATPPMTGNDRQRSPTSRAPRRQTTWQKTRVPHKQNALQRWKRQ